MKKYLDLMSKVLNEGTVQKNRTGIDTLMIPGEMIQFDLREGFPAVTTKKLAFNAVKGELIGFLRGYTSAAQFRELGCKIWDQNANENEAWLNNPYREGEDDLGYIYSRLWTDMPTSFDAPDLPKEQRWNQIDLLIEEIKSNPSSRRLIVSAWHPEVFDRCALPPCHYGFQVIIEQETRTMHLLWNQRSVDVFLGLPFNIASYSLLLHMLCNITGYKPGTVTGFLADVHIYANHRDACYTQLERAPHKLPTLLIAKRPVSNIAEFSPEDFMLQDYSYDEPIKAPMAV